MSAPIIRPMWQVAAIGMSHDADGLHVLALWLACFMQAYEATHPEA